MHDTLFDSLRVPSVYCTFEWAQKILLYVGTWYISKHVIFYLLRCWLACYGSPSTWLGPCRVHPCRRGISLYRDTTLIQPYFREFDKYFNIQIFWAASPFPLLYWELRTCQGETLARVRENDKRVHPYTAGKQNCSPWFRFQSQMGGWIACGQAKGFCSRP